MRANTKGEALHKLIRERFFIAVLAELDKPWDKLQDETRVKWNDIGSTFAKMKDRGWIKKRPVGIKYGKETEG